MDQSAPSRSSAFYRALTRFFHGETLAERTERMLAEEERQRRILLNEAQDLAKLHSRRAKDD
ncbi:hypothetical protein [Medusavirus stheno T3]|uniref:Uncharacterized protein n=1 Tax=Medusavirus stheno T3 TaxID=3069717 RepID=A0A7S8BDT5_9VIRU|nr:hypothetical protein QKU73_gp221 [Acanthamoeba castellanii medusavirus]QPB44554.1 hypothetical protein [Medusavirus stheno T3]